MSPIKKRTVTIIGSTLLSLGIITTIILVAVQFNKANNAANTYTQKTVEHLQEIGKQRDNEQERITTFRTRVVLKTVAFGSIVSPQYRAAQDTQKEYNNLLDEAAPFFEQNYTLATLPGLIQDVSATALMPVPQSGDTVTKVANVQERAVKLATIATKLNDCYFDDEFKPLKITAVDNLRKMSASSEDIADLINKGDDKASPLNTLQSEYLTSYEAASNALRKMPPYGVKIGDYLKNNKDPLDANFQMYIVKYSGK